MLFTYIRLNNHETKLNTSLKTLELSSGQEITYFSNEQFKEHRKILEEENRTVSIIRNTKLKEVSGKERNKIFTKEYKEKYPDRDFLKIENTYYHLLEERGHSSVGYLYVGDDKFIRIEKSKTWPIIILPVVLFLMLGSGLLFNPSDDKKPSSDMPVIEGTSDTGNEPLDESNNNSRVKFAGFKTAIVSKDKPCIKLENNSDTDFGFVYQISKKMNIEVVESFSTYDEAKKYVMKNSTTVENDYSSNDYKVKVNGEPSKYFSTLVVNVVSENKYEVIKTDYKVLYFTGAIKNGASVDWNAYQMLDDTSDVHIVVDTYNFDKKTYDTSMSFDATIVKK